MKTCVKCAYRDQEDSCCWCSASPRYLHEVDGDTLACEDFEPEEIEQEEESNGNM